MSDLNDPRVLFAAERTLLAWHRTSLTLMAFGFVIERFGLFMAMLQGLKHPPRDASFWVGCGFIVLGSLVAVLAVVQYRKLLKTLKPVEIPTGYWVNFSVLVNLLLAILGLLLLGYLFSHV